jgi:hypothetical protein
MEFMGTLLTGSIDVGTMVNNDNDNDIWSARQLSSTRAEVERGRSEAMRTVCGLVKSPTPGRDAQAA